ncbi:hypothetical protein BD626DRAFT_2009 [Schizophyllum amplum]|uniref:BTB domain-containing protein n=1 Tax=Schizophyllum amplum TaxID=97359 RepID=A0A550CVQ5_9AGAR|nr:hypothetical protein BD626DRAFT_2009 [Auriculariopsis ampla]
MGSRSRSPSVESFGSAESMSIPASPSTSESPDLPPGISNEVVEPRVLSANHHELHRFYLRDGNVKFELDDGKLYNVHRYFFETHAPQFAAEHMRGRQFESIKLRDVSSVDFERFLSMIYPTELGKCDLQTVDEWTSVLRLASQWSINSLRSLAIREIEPKASPVDKVVIAREFHLKSWLLPAFTDICDASEWLNHDEAERLGLSTVVDIGRIREQQRQATSPHRRAHDIRTAVLSSSTLVPVSFDDDEISSTDNEKDEPAISSSHFGAVTVAPFAAEVEIEPSPSVCSEHSEDDEYFATPKLEPQADIRLLEELPSSPLDRALYALDLVDKSAGKGLQYAARIDSIVQQLADSSDLQLDIPVTLAMEEALQRVEQRIAMLIARQVSRRVAMGLTRVGHTRGADQGQDTLLTVSIVRSSMMNNLRMFPLNLHLKEKLRQ